MRSSLRCQGPGIQQGQLKFEDNSSIQGNSTDLHDYIKSLNTRCLFGSDK
jgi:hypothetical protein